jgi:hypothetical protein
MTLGMTLSQVSVPIAAADNSGEGLSTAYTGDEILAYAKETYDDWGYQEVDTCTGFVSRVFYEDLKVPNGMEIAGPRVFVGYGWEPYNGYLTENNPDEMLDIAYKLVNQGKAQLVYEGTASGSYDSETPLRNGDIVITSAAEMGAQYGHVAIIEVRDDGTQGWFGAHGEIGTHEQEVSYMAFAKNKDDKEYTTGTDEDADETYSGMIHVFRVVDYEEPDIKTDIATTKDIDYSLAVKKTGTDGTPLEDETFTFKSGTVNFKTETDSQGMARYTVTKSFELNADDYQYIDNYDKLSPEDKTKIDDSGIYKSREEAQTAADAALLSLAHETTVDFSDIVVTDLNSGITYQLNTESEVNPDATVTLTVEDAKLTKEDVKVLGYAAGAKCAIYDSEDTLVEEFITTDSGYTVKNLNYGETYTVKEIQEPTGYIKSEDIHITVGSSDNTAYLNETPIQGSIDIHTYGNVFTGYDSDGLPVYEKQELQDVVYRVYAQEDIKSGTKIVYQQGSEVTTTGGTISDLPVGHYSFEVVEAPEGYVLDGTRYDFTVEVGSIADPYYEQDIDISLQTCTLSVQNLLDVGIANTSSTVSVYRKNGTLVYTSTISGDGRVVKSDSVQLPVGEYYVTVDDNAKKYNFTLSSPSNSIGTYTYKVDSGVTNSSATGVINVQVNTGSSSIDLSGISIALSTDEEFTDSNTTVLSTDSSGKVAFDDLPYGVYYIRQNDSTGSYEANRNLYAVEISNSMSSAMLTLANQQTAVVIESKDIDGILTVEGAEIEILNTNGEVVDEWTTGKMVHLVSGLTDGEEYTIHVVNAAEGYDVPEDLVFTMKSGKTITVESSATESVISVFLNTLININRVFILTMTIMAVVVLLWRKPWLPENMMMYEITFRKLRNRK